MSDDNFHQYLVHLMRVNGLNWSEVQPLQFKKEEILKSYGYQSFCLRLSIDKLKMDLLNKFTPVINKTNHLIKKAFKL